MVQVANLSGIVNTDIRSLYIMYIMLQLYQWSVFKYSFGSQCHKKEGIYAGKLNFTDNYTVRYI
jgi:hypothetical protein